MQPLAIQYPISPLGKQLRVMQWGMEGPAVLLLHGLGSRADIWRLFAPLVAAQGYRCFAIDMPGHGLSWKGSDFDYSITGHVPLIEAICQEIGETSVDLIGSSLGGIHAAAFAAQRPSMVRSLTLVGAIGLKVMTPERCEWTASYLSDMSRDSIAARLARAVFDPSIFDQAYIEESYRINNSPGAASAWSAIATYYRQGINDDTQTQALAALKGAVPILLLWGKDDPTVAYEGALEAVEVIAGSTLVGIAETKHMPQLERPQISAEYVLRLIRKDPAYQLPGKADASPSLEIIRHQDRTP
ncbi:alpha/beta fold hydrolase [Limibacillus halophilus]|uniref:Pyruvate dehydrogenase E2 component (Dihydrolipoamide acetyltransferase) n=1 Tax=Limibacillus halophilus TaxID=1579333 RepID=A0A839SPE2_9PROT|nr:alpha/beta hydrolase [Limibacillus halophilus]MBB3064312.1 pyruvate dehydrogenase E2 component (dihydrolipoamide acetyltransferase) [Limibacillus halophilus]